MGGWSSDEEEEVNRFQATAADFTPVNTDVQDSQKQLGYDLFAPQEPQQAECNYFYEKLGFRVGNFFEGEKRLHTKRPRR